MCVNTWFSGDGERITSEAGISQAKSESAALTGIDRTHPHQTISQMWAAHRERTWGTRQPTTDFQGFALALNDGSCIPVWM